LWLRGKCVRTKLGTWRKFGVVNRFGGRKGLFYGRGKARCRGKFESACKKGL